MDKSFIPKQKGKLWIKTIKRVADELKLMKSKMTGELETFRIDKKALRATLKEDLMKTLEFSVYMGAKNLVVHYE